MSLFVALLLIVIATAVAAGAGVLVHRHVHVELRRQHNEIGTAVFLQLGVIFAVLLAFVFSEVWNEYNSAASAVEMEAKDLVGAATLASALPTAEGQPVLKAERVYINGVIYKEWPDMEQRRRESHVAQQNLATIIQTVVHMHPSDPSDIATRSQLMNFLEDAQLNRSTRLFQVGSGVPGLLWALLIGFGIILGVFVALAGVENGGALISFAATFAAAVAAILVLIHLLDYPFEGALALSPQPFSLALDRINELSQ